MTTEKYSSNFGSKGTPLVGSPTKVPNKYASNAINAKYQKSTDLLIQYVLVHLNIPFIPRRNYNIYEGML